MGRPALSSDLDEIERVMRKRNMASSNKLLEALHLHHSPERLSVTVDGIVEVPPDRTRQIEPVEQWVERQKNIHKPWFSIVEEIEPKITIAKIQQVVCNYYGVSRDAMNSARRTWDIVRPRHIGYYLSKTLTPHTLPQIGRRFGGRDHTTALFGIRKIQRLRLTDAALDAEIVAITSLLGGAVA